VFGYEPEWPVVSSARREDVAALIGEPEAHRPAGPEAGEHAGFPGAGDPTRHHMNLRGAGEPASESG